MRPVAVLKQPHSCTLVPGKKVSPLPWPVPVTQPPAVVVLAKTRPEIEPEAVISRLVVADASLVSLPFKNLASWAAAVLGVSVAAARAVKWTVTVRVPPAFKGPRLSQCRLPLPVLEGGGSAARNCKRVGSKLSSKGSGLMVLLMLVQEGSSVVTRKPKASR